MVRCFFSHLHSLSSVQWCASQSWRWKRERVATQQPKTPRCANSALLSGKGWKEIRTKSQSRSPWRRPLPTRTTMRDVSKPKWLVCGTMSVKMGRLFPELREVKGSNVLIMAQCPVGSCSEKQASLGHPWKEGLIVLWNIVASRNEAPMKDYFLEHISFSGEILIV